jgi:deoxyribonuclease IV
MAEHARFGPSGVPHMFKQLGAKLPDVPKLLRTEDLDAFEYSAVRWGQEPQISQQLAEQLRVEAQKNDVKVSIHGTYFLNLLGNKEVTDASKRRLIACARAAEWMGAYVVVFHPGFYGELGKVEALGRCIEVVREVQSEMQTLGIRNVKLGAETMGRHSQFGTLDEIIALCQAVEGMQLVIDWSHLHARSGGGLRSVEDFRKIVARVEEDLGAEAARGMHCHFSKIEFTYKSGERRHHPLDEPAYGPDFAQLAEVVAEFKLHPVFICETVVQDVDAAKMRDMLRKVLE